MPPERTRLETGNADVLLWQSGYRITLALLAGGLALALRVFGDVPLATTADEVLGAGVARFLIPAVSALYVTLVLLVRWRVSTTRLAGATTATIMVVADIVIIFWLVFLVSVPADYDRALILSLFSLQLTHVYFGRRPALLMLVAVASAYLLLNDIAMLYGEGLSWNEVLATLVLFLMGAFMVILVQSNLHRRLATLVGIFERAEEGDFSYAYDVAGDRRPDAITMVGRAYNRMRAQLASIVVTDPLSGCLNRRGFEQQYRRELARAARIGSEVTLIAVDLDHFKNVNDTHGHLVGDRVIAQSGSLLRATARTGDVVARIGGEEFLILAPATNARGAMQLATRVVDAFRNAQFTDGEGGVRVTVSAGVVAELVRDASMAEDLRARADEALYAAKRTGRNRVVLWTPGLLELQHAAR